MPGYLMLLSSGANARPPRLWAFCYVGLSTYATFSDLDLLFAAQIILTDKSLWTLTL